MNKRKKVYIFTNLYPYGTMSENFLTQELEQASKEYDIYLIPIQKKTHQRHCPPHVVVDDFLCRLSVFKKAMLFIQMLFRVPFWRMLWHERRKIKTVYSLFQGVKYFFGGCMVRYFFLKNKHQIPRKSVFYSYWFSFTALGLAMIKHDFPEWNASKFISRAHGYDAFSEDRNIFIPCRTFTLSQLDTVYSVSKTGMEYLRKQYPSFSQKIQTSYLGIKAMEESGICRKKIKKADISFLSCSSFVPVKRIELILRSIKLYSLEHPDTHFCWTHIGGGISQHTFNPEEVKSYNLKMELKGQKTIEEIYEIYASEHFDIFLNMSLSEGLPVSLMEAINAGIPLIATDAGGTNEIVCQQTGKLLPLYFDQKEFNQAVDYILENKQKLFLSCRKYFLENFLAENNYKRFYNQALFTNE